MTAIIAFLSRNKIGIRNPWMESRDYVRPVRGALSKDFYRVVGDMRTVGSDLRSVAKKELAENGK